MVPSDYDNELLILAQDVANRLLAAFEYSSTQIPYPRVSINYHGKVQTNEVVIFWIPVKTGSCNILEWSGRWTPRANGSGSLALTRIKIGNLWSCDKIQALMVRFCTIDLKLHPIAQFMENHIIHETLHSFNKINHLFSWRFMWKNATCTSRFKMIYFWKSPQNLPKCSIS